MRKDKEKATQLRKLGKSYRQIRDELKIPLSTLSDWFTDIGWSQALAKKLAAAVQEQHTTRIVELNIIRGLHLDRLYTEARVEAAQDLEKLKYNPLFIAGVMLYWGEGDKGANKGGVRLANTDPALIELYVHFLLHVCRIPIEKIKGHILFYPDLEEKLCRKYWSEVSGLPASNFTQSTLIQGRHKTRRLSHGVCIITVSSSYLKEKMREWLNLLPSQLMEKAYYENITNERL